MSNQLKKLPQEFYTFEDAIEYMQMNHSISISKEELFKRFLNNELNLFLHIDANQKGLQAINSKYKFNNIDGKFIDACFNKSFPILMTNEDGEEKEIDAEYMGYFNFSIINYQGIVDFNIPGALSIKIDDEKYLGIRILNKKYFHVLEKEMLIKHDELIQFVKIDEPIENIKELQAKIQKLQAELNDKNKKISTASDNKKNAFIKALLLIKYGKDVAENPRPYVYDPNLSGKSRDGVIQKDFELHGLQDYLPSGKTLKNWVDSIEIESDS